MDGCADAVPLVESGFEGFWSVFEGVFSLEMSFPSGIAVTKVQVTKEVRRKVRRILSVDIDILVLSPCCARLWLLKSCMLIRRICQLTKGRLLRR